MKERYYRQTPRVIAIAATYNHKAAVNQAVLSLAALAALMATLL